MSGERFETWDNGEQLLVNTALTQTVKGAVQCFQYILDTIFRSLHGRKTTRVLTGKRFGASAEERDKQIFVDQRAQRDGTGARDFRQKLGRPSDRCQLLLPLKVEWKQTLTNWLIESA